MATIRYIAAHRLEVPQEGDISVAFVGAAEASTFHRDAVTELSSYVDYLDRIDDAVGRAQPAWWNDGGMPAELSDLGSCTSVADFDTATRGAMARLQAGTPRTASSGILLFLRGERDGGQDFVALLKMSPTTVDHAMFNPEAPPSDAITVAHLENVLPKPRDLRKAAVLPNPTGPPLRVVDLQVRELASYWLNFLGAATGPRPKEVAKALAETAVSALVDQEVAPADAREAVAAGIEEAGAAEDPVVPQQFVEDVARRARAEPERAWSQAVELDPELTDEHLELPPTVVKDLTTTIDLGGGVTISGPASQVDPRATIAMDDVGWYVKVRATQEPEPHTQ